jgi:hypothetical protein
MIIRGNLKPLLDLYWKFVGNSQKRMRYLNLGIASSKLNPWIESASNKSKSH